MAKRKVSKKARIKAIKKMGAPKSFNGGLQSPSDLFSIGSNKVQKSANFSVTQNNSFFYSPELTTESWLLPKSRQEILKWVRIFFNLEPYIQSITMMHAMYPFSKFDLITSDDTVTEFYKDMVSNEKFDLFRFILQASLSYHKFGEAIAFGTMDKGEDGLHRWSKFILLEPELVEIKTDMLTGDQDFELIPTQELKALVESNKAENAERVEALNKESPEVVRAVKEGRNIKLDPKNASMVAARYTDPSATRGTSPIQSCFKVLIYQDWIRLAQSAFAQRYIFPLELWTIGDLANNIIPDEDTIEKYKDLIKESIQNPPFSIVVPPIVKYEPLSTLGKQFPINNEYEYIQDQILVALGVNKNIILGEGPSFSNVKTMALHKLMTVYKTFRDEIEQWMIYKFFKPIAEKNGFYTLDPKTKKKKYILPEISWYKSLDIEEQEAEREMFLKLHADGYISTKTLFSKFPSLDYETEQKKLEAERGTVWDKGDDRIPKRITKPSGSPSGAPSGGPDLGLVKPIRPVKPERPGKPEEGTPGVEKTPETTEVPEAATEIPTPTEAPAEAPEEVPVKAPPTP